MTMPNSPAAGWYADPNGGPALRYWDGAGWTDATQPAPVAAGYPAPGSARATPGYPSATPGYPAGTPGSAPGTPGYPAASPYPGAPQANRPAVGFAARNKFFLITAAICGVYALVATFSNFALFGVLPALYTFRSFQAKEPLAGVALAVTVVTIFFSLNHIYR
jgi:hypothetical protein